MALVMRFSSIETMSNFTIEEDYLMCRQAQEYGRLINGL
jgi:hypothetical protein